MKRLVTLAVLGCCAFVHAQEVFGDDKQSFMLSPAEVISSGVVSQAEFSNSGRYITYRRQEIPNFEAETIGPKQQTTYSWYRYDRNTKANVKLPVPVDVQSVSCMGDEQTVFFVGQDSKQVQGFANIKTGLVTKTNFDILSLFYWGDRPEAPYLAFKSTDNKIVLVSSNGSTLSFAVPQNIVPFSPIATTASSITFAGMLQSKPPKFGHIIFQRSDGSASFKETSREGIQSDLAPQQPERKFMVMATGEIDFVMTNATVKTANPEVPPKAKLTTARSFSRFSPNNDSVAYLVSGALLIRDIKPIDRLLALKISKDAAKQKAITDAKQVVLALIMFASDVDDTLPGQEGWESKVLPYSQDMDMLRRFNYTFRGGNMANVESPATTEMGFILGPGGRAVAYVDGHVKWIPNP